MYHHYDETKNQLIMVKLNNVQESNAAMRSTSSGQVALFVGATSGIAFHTLTEFTRNSNRPKVYIVGRSDAKLSNIITELERINPEGSYVPIRSEISLLKNVDAACEEYKRKEKRLDLLVMCPGYLKLSRIGTHFLCFFRGLDSMKREREKANCNEV
jgi:NAD(P)-dependent dehydrogenase (short-subunit alcohol dehydrogenase family)